MALYSQLFLRNTTSPYGDFTRNSVLSFKDLDQNFIFLKERDITNINYSSNTLTIETLGGNSFSTTIVNSDTFVTGGTYNPSTISLDFTGNSGFTPFNVDVSSLTDTYVSGGVYDPNTGCVTFSTTSGYTFDVCGFVTGNTLEQVLVNGNVSSGNNIIISDDDILQIGSSDPTWQFSKNSVNGRLEVYNTDEGFITQLFDQEYFHSVGISGQEWSFVGTSGYNDPNFRVRIESPNSDTQNRLLISSVGLSASTFSGLTYLTDYSSNFTNRSLVDKEYVDNSGYWSSQTGALVDTNTTISHTTLNTNTNSIIGGGQNNKLDNSDNAVIIGGINNNILSGNTSFIIGGSNNDIQARSGSDLGQSGVLGGSNNNIIDVSSDSDRSFIIGGINNDINNAVDSIILSSGVSDITGPSTQNTFILGSSGSLVNSSFFSGLVGGFNNELNGVSRSVILGGQNITGTTSDTVYVPYLRVIDGVNIGTPNPSVDLGPPINVINNDAVNSINVGSGNTLSGNYSMTLGNNLRAIGDGLLVGGTSSNTPIIYGGNAANYSISWGRDVEMFSDQTDALCNIAVGDDINFIGGRGNAVFGNENTIKNNDSCIITGSLNRMENNNGLHPSISSSIIGGSGNTINKTTRGAIIGGISNEFPFSIVSPPEDSVIIGGDSNIMSHNRSVILGGQNITSTSNDTVYVPYLNISNIGTGTSISNLGFDSNGNVVTGKTGPDSITFEIFNTSPTSPDPYTIYDDGNIRLLFDEAATDDIEIVVLTNPSTGPVHVVWSEPTAGTSGSANVTTASGQIPLNTEVSADDVVDFVIWAPEDSSYPYYEAKVTVSNGTFTSIPAVARVSKWNTPS